MLRSAVIGMGHIGNLHARIHKEQTVSELVAVCDRDHERADAAAKALGVPAYYDAQEMLDREKPDVVSITTGGYEYSSDHYEPTMQALRAGCHVLGEKPISNDLRHAQEMVDLAEKMGVCYGIDMNHRFTPAARAAKKWQDDGRIGELGLLQGDA